MTSVLPAWKLELIEKKKKKEQDNRQKIEEEKSRKVFIPEWKRSLLEKKKEVASDSPETKDQALCVNSVFGPRILRKPSQTNLSIVNSSHKPVVRGDDEENKIKRLQDVNTSRGGPALYSSPADTNSCVTKAVEIPTEVEHKPNKLSTQREVENNRKSSPRSDATAMQGEDSKMTLDIQQSETKLSNEHVKAPSVFNYRRMFEQSKPEISKETSEPRIAKNTESIKPHVQNDKMTTDCTLGTAISESHPSSSQLQISNKSTVDNEHSIHSEKSTRLHADSSDRKISTPKPSFTPKPYKTFVTTPPWLKSTAPRNVNFQIGNNSVQEDIVVANVNSEVQSTSKDFDTSEEKSVVVVESAAKENAKNTIENDDDQKISFDNHNDLVMPSTNKDEESVQTVLPPEQTVQKYSIVKEADEEEQLATKTDKDSDELKYILIDSRNQHEPPPTKEKEITLVSATIDNVSQVPNELVPQNTEDDVSNSSSIQSLRSKFGSIGGFRKRTLSEENLFLKGNQAEPSETGSVIRRSAELKRPPAPMKRWSADVISLMSRSFDDDDDMSNLSPRSDTKTNNQLKRPPPPVKRWTADAITVVSRQIDDGASNSLPRIDPSKTFSPSNSLNRDRSSSLCDIREDAGLDYFQHKSNVSHGIEHRVNKLIRKVSISDTQLIVNGEESDSTSDDDPISDPLLDSHTQVTFENEIHSPVYSPEQDTKPVFARKHSISTDIEHRVTELFHRQLSQQSDADESEGEKITESDAKITVVQVVDDVKEPPPENLKTEAVSIVSTTALVDLDSTSTVKDDAKQDSDPIVPESKPVRGSVHKLSAMFGSSIWKPNKKDKSGNEEKTKDKASVGSKQQKIHSTEKSNQKGSSVEKDDSKKSSLFNKSHKTEAKSAQKDKQQSNKSIFPWIKKHDKEKESTGGNKTKEVVDKNQKNSSSSPDEGTDTMSIAAHGLRPVRKAGKVEQRLVGNVVIVSNASHEQTPPKGVYHKTKPNVQIPEPEKEKMPAKKANDSKTDIKRNEPQIPTVVTQYWNGHQKSPDSGKSGNESVPITSIDEVPVSAIDMPESSDVTISVIDVPASPDVRSAEKFTFLNGHKEEIEHPADEDVSVSVIDLPSPGNEERSNTFQEGYLEADELSDGSDVDEVEGSYDFATGEVSHLVNGDISQDDEEEEDDDEEEEDDDEDDEEEDVPISYIGAAPQYPVPQVVFDSEPVQLKSCLSPKIERKKVRIKIFTLYKNSYGLPLPTLHVMHHEMWAVLTLRHLVLALRQLANCACDWNLKATCVLSEQYYHVGLFVFIFIIMDL